MDAEIDVARARVTYLATRVSSEVVEELGNPQRFEALLASPRDVAGLTLSLPFPKPSVIPNNVDRTFWSYATENPKPGQIVSASPYDLRRGGLPLRHGVSVSPRSIGKPRLEIFCYGFGCVVLATLDIFLNPPIALAGLSDSLSTATNVAVQSTVGPSIEHHAFPTIAECAADRVIQLLSRNGSSWQLDPYRLVSVIDASGRPQLDEMPIEGGLVHKAMHQLSLGGPARPAPGDAFLPYWAGRNAFGWAGSELVYVLDSGSAQLRQSAALRRPQPPAWSTSDYHRLLTLARMHVSVDMCLLAAAGEANSERLSAWAKVAAFRLSRLYGPKPASYDFWGLACRSFILSDPAAVDRIEAARADQTKLFGLAWPVYPSQAPS
jgi:hypothetical protein